MIYSLLGILWVILQPILSVIVFSFLFGTLMQVPTGEIPYPLFSLAALLPWSYFSSSLTRTSTSLVNNSNLLTKVYFPRLLIPLSGVLSGLVDLAVGLLIYIILMIIYKVQLSLYALLLPYFICLALLTALGFGLWFSALNIRYRDINYLVPFIVQLWMYITPVVYGTSLIPKEYAFIFIINPMTAVVEGFRLALLGNSDLFEQNFLGMLIFSLALVIFVLMTGLIYFRNTERILADII